MSRLEIECEPAGGPAAPGCVSPRQCLPADLREGDVERKINRTIAYMKEHLDQPLQAAVLASQASVSLSHYFALFKRRTGCTPIDYFIHLRMERARDLLEETSLTVKEIAAALGYDDQFYFSRVFKSINGLPPTNYRSARQSGQSLSVVPRSLTAEPRAAEALVAVG